MARNIFGRVCVCLWGAFTNVFVRFYLDFQYYDIHANGSLCPFIVENCYRSVDGKAVHTTYYTYRPPISTKVKSKIGGKF